MAVPAQTRLAARMVAKGASQTGSQEMSNEQEIAYASA
jgi:hypothetical protein